MSMVDEEKFSRLHLAGRNRLIDHGIAHCGVSLGNITSDPERVTCPNCKVLMANVPPRRGDTHKE